MGTLWQGWRRESEMTLAVVSRVAIARTARVDIHALGGVSLTRMSRETYSSGVDPMTHEVYQGRGGGNVEIVPGLLLGADTPLHIGRHLAVVPRARVFVTTRQVMGVFSPPRGLSLQLFIGVGLRWLS
jgi:hypothetical protein